ncbi:MAG: TIGR03013 family XrtA/PEP-CTERM system glycosyltransferase [Thermodesulfovibrionales bacterium]|jgi:sugar transferase (PEP-CTERM system associated)
MRTTDFTKPTLLLLGDVTLSVFAVNTSYLLRFGQLEIAYNSELLALAVFTLVLAFSSFVATLYDLEKRLGKKELLGRIAVVIGTSFIVLCSIFYVMPAVMLGRGVFIASLCIFGMFQFIWHVTYRTCINFPGLARKVLILGTGPLAKKMGELIASTNHHHVVGGYVKLASEEVDVPAHAIVGNGGGLMETIHKERAHKLVVSLSERRGIFPLQDVLDCKFSGIEVVDAPSFYEDLTGKLLIEDITPSWFIFSNGFKMTPAMRYYKRALDIFFSMLGLLMVMPFIPLLALAVKLDSRGPIFFRQVRVGEREKRFVLYKFRTMREDAETTTGAIWAQSNDPRITRVGRFLRTTRLDEIPQLYNVLRGDMSFIGPRPERPEFIEMLSKIIPYYTERHFVKPGISGWAQVRYPYGASVEDAIEKLRYDLYYIKNISLVLDIVIIIETVKVMLFGKGAR